MAISPSLSTAEVIVGAAGALPDTTTVVTLRVTARTTANAAPAGPTQVRVTPLTGGALLYVDHEHVRPSFPDIAFSYTDALGVVDIPLRSGTQVTTQYLVEIGEDDGRIAYTENGQINKPTTNSVVGPTELSVGPQFAYTRSFGPDPLVLDEAWLVANNTVAGVTSRVVRQTLFAGPVTLAVNPATGQEASIFFANCIFAVQFSENYALTTNNIRFEAGFCAFRGSALAAVNGEGGKYTRCVWDTVGRDGVRIEQGGSNFSNTGLPDDYTSSTFLSCLFRRVGVQTDGYCVRGTPMRNVVFDHVWFDVAHELAAVPQTTASGSISPYGSCLGSVYQSTDVDGARGPRLYGCWIGGGETAQITWAEGGSNSAPQFGALRANRFDLDRAAPSCEYLLDEMSTSAAPSTQGNMDDADGRLIDNDDHPGVNRTAGALFLWPQTTLDVHPVVVWQNAGTGGPGGPGTGPGQGSEIGTASLLGEDLLYSVRNALDTPLGGGPGDVIIHSRPYPGTVSEAVPMLLGGVVIPPDEPLIVEWDTATSNLNEGGSVVVVARLFSAQGGTPATGKLEGFAVPLTVVYSGAGSSAGDFVIPATADFAVGASVAQVTIEAVDDVDFEGAEVATVTLGALTGLNSAGDVVVKVEPGDQDDHAVTILPNDAPGVVQVFMGLTALSVIEGPQNPTQVQIPVRITGNPSAQVPVRVTFTGTANLSGVTAPADYSVANPKLPGSPNVVPLVFQPGGPQEILLDLSIIDDFVYETPDETIVMTLTCQAAATVAVVAAAPNDVCTVTIDEYLDPPAVVPTIGWQETSLTLREIVIGPGGVPQAVNRAVGIRTATAGSTFSFDTDVEVEIIPTSQFPAYLAGQEPLGESHDYELLFEPPNAGTITGGAGGAWVGIVPFATGENARSIVIAVAPDNISENPAGEQFRLRIRDAPAGEYLVNPALRDLNVTLLDPLGGDTYLLTPRLQANTPAGTPPARSLVAVSIPLVSGVTTSAGFTMAAAGEESTCQWHPLSYKADGTPADVRLWGLLGGSSASVPGQSSAMIVRGGASTDPTGLINLDTQIAAAYANDLRLTLGLNVNGETDLFELDIAGGVQNPMVDTAATATLQGGGPRLFGRRVVRGPLRADSAIPGGSCTVARVTIDTRADMNAVALAINWGNYRWKKPTTAAGHTTTNDYVDGEVFFDYLDLNGIPAGWAAVVLDPRTTVSEYDSGGARVRIIKPLGGTARHYLPPLRGHIAYVVLYETATVSAETAREILDGQDMAYAFGSLGIDRNDFMGEQGTPVMNYGEGQVPFRDSNQSGTPPLTGWAGAANFAQRDLIRIETTSLGTGASDVEGVGAVAQHWWHPFSYPAGGNPSGERINISGGVYPSKWRRRRSMFELVHLWQRVGGVPWSEKAEEITDEDFCIDDGPNLRSAVATWMGIGGQRMGHHHFYVPDYAESGSGAHADVKRGPGRKRATGSVAMSALPTAGENIVIDDGNGGVLTFIFGTGTDTGTDKYVAIGTSVSATLTNLNAKIRSLSNPASFRVWSSQASPGVTLKHRYHGTQGNATVTTTGAAITATGMSGGSNGMSVRLWNYLVPGSNTCTEDMHLDWFSKAMDGDLAYHSFDWPHMSRMHEATREGWWCFFDPIAHDCATGLMHLGTQCLMRYRETRTNSVYIGTGGITQLASSCTANNLALIREAILGQYLRVYVERNFDSQHPAAQFSAVVAANGGLNCGAWRTRNPTENPPGVQPNPFNPQTAQSYMFNGAQQWAIDRGWAWIMAAVTRGYAIDGVMRPTALKDLHRTRIHPGINTEGDARPSWFELVRFAIQNTMHRSGAASSQDVNSTADLYTSLGAPDFGTHSKSLPGGSQNVPVGGVNDDEWYANFIAWHANFIAMGAYAVNRRVYSWCDRDTIPNVQVQTNPWASRLRGLWDFGRLLFLAAKAQFGPQHFFVPTFHPVGAGNPATVGQATSVGRYGRFNTETGAADPFVTFRTGHPWWWSYSSPIGSTGLNYYYVQYLMWSWMYVRMYGRALGTITAEAAEMLDTHPGLVGAGGLPIDQAAPGVVSQLMTEWESVRVNSPALNSADEYAWAVQWHRNELGAP